MCVSECKQREPSTLEQLEKQVSESLANLKCARDSVKGILNRLNITKEEKVVDSGKVNKSPTNKIESLIIRVEEFSEISREIGRISEKLSMILG